MAKLASKGRASEGRLAPGRDDGEIVAITELPWFWGTKGGYWDGWLRLVMTTHNFRGPGGRPFTFPTLECPTCKKARLPASDFLHPLPHFLRIVNGVVQQGKVCLGCVPPSAVELPGRAWMSKKYNRVELDLYLQLKVGVFEDERESNLKVVLMGKKGDGAGEQTLNTDKLQSRKMNPLWWCEENDEDLIIRLQPATWRPGDAEFKDKIAKGLVSKRAAASRRSRT